MRVNSSNANVRQDTKTENMFSEELKTQEENTMAKIDVSKIEGFEAMTPEEKLNALLAFEYEDNTSELERYKSAVTKANSEAADWKKKHNALLTAEELAKQTRDDEVSSLKDKIAELEKKEAISVHKAKFLGLGYDEALAEATAKALHEGDMETVFANQKKFNDNYAKKIEADLLKGTSNPPAGKEKQVSKDDIMKITDPAERQKLIADNIELFDEA
jgi:hypothetical protein